MSFVLIHTVFEEHSFSRTVPFAVVGPFATEEEAKAYRDANPVSEGYWDPPYAMVPPK